MNFCLQEIYKLNVLLKLDNYLLPNEESEIKRFLYHEFVHLRVIFWFNTKQKVMFHNSKIVSELLKEKCINLFFRFPTQSVILLC